MQPKILNQIRRYRVQARMTQRQAARRCRVRLSTYRSWEWGMAWPTKQRLFDLAIALGTSIEALYPEQYFGKKRALTLAAERA